MRHCRHRRQRLYHDRLDWTDRRPALHRRYLPRGGIRRRAEPAGHHRLGPDHLAVAIDARVLSHWLDGEGADAAHRHRRLDAAPAGTLRPQGQKVTIPMSAGSTDSRWLELIGFALVAAIILILLPLVLY